MNARILLIAMIVLGSTTAVRAEWKLEEAEGMCVLVDDKLVDNKIVVQENEGEYTISFEKYEKFDLNQTKVFGHFQGVEGFAQFGIADYGFATFRVEEDIVAIDSDPRVLITVDGDDSYWFHFSGEDLDKKMKSLGACNDKYNN